MPAWDGNYSRDMFPSSRRKQYVRGRMQQGKEVADADRNDNADLQYEKLRNFIQKIAGDAFFFGDGFKITADGSDNDVQVEPGSGYLAGHEAYLGLSARYVNLGASQEDVNLHSVSTGLTATVLTDTSMNWVVNELAGRELFPNLQDATSFTVLSNTATEITVAGDMTVGAAAGDSYYIAMSTPSGGNRTDTVWMNLYLDEVSADEDNYLFHNLGSGIELDRRIKARTVIMVEQGASTYADYIDLDGNQHYLVKLATIFRTDGVAAINPIDVVDDRVLTASAGGSLTVSSTDTTGGFLDDKIVTQTPLAKQILNSGGNESLQLYINAPGDGNKFLRGTSPPTWADVVGGGGGGGGSGAALEGRTFQPLSLQSERSLGNLYLHSVGTTSGDKSGGLDISTAEGGRSIPSNATHVHLTLGISDMNVTAASGTVTYSMYIGPTGTSFPDPDYVVGSVNAAPNGEGSNTSFGSLILPLDPGAPTFDWFLEYSTSGGGTVDFLKLDAWVDGFYIEDAGSAPTPVSFSASKTTNQFTSDASGAVPDVVVNWDTPEHNNGGAFDPVSGQFVAPVDGVYQFVASAGWSNVINFGISPQQLVCYLFKNGVAHRQQSMVAGESSENTPSQMIADEITLAAGDVVTFRVAATNSGSFPGVGAQVIPNTWFSGSLTSSVGGSALEGATFVPASGAEKVQWDESLAFSGDTSRTIDFSVTGTGGNVITPPTKATHALVRVKLDVDATGTLDDGGNMRAFVGPYTGTPASLATTDNQCCLVSLNETLEGNATDTASIVVELNDPVDPTGDLTLHLTWSGGGAVDLQVGITVWVEGWYVQQDVATILSGTFALEGKTFLPDQRQLLVTPNDGLNKNGTFDITSVPSNATHALIRVSGTSDGNGNSFVWNAAAFNQAISPGTFPVGSIGASGQMGPANDFHDVQGNVLVDITGVVLGRVGYEITAVTGTVGSGTFQAIYDLIGFYIDDTGTEPEVANGAILATVAGGSAGAGVVDIIDFTWPEATTHLRIIGSAAFTSGGNGDLSHTITLAQGSDGQITGQATAEALDVAISERIIYNNTDVVNGLVLWDDNPASPSTKELRIRVWDTSLRRIVIEHDVGVSSESGVLIEAVG